MEPAQDSNPDLCGRQLHAFMQVPVCPRYPDQAWLDLRIHPSLVAWRGSHARKAGAEAGEEGAGSASWQSVVAPSATARGAEEVPGTRRELATLLQKGVDFWEAPHRGSSVEL